MKGDRLKSGKVRYRLYIGKDSSGKKRWKSFTADSLRQAKKDAQTWLATNPQHGTNITLTEACDRFLEGRTNTLSPSTWNDYNNRIKYLQDQFPDLFKLSIRMIDTDRMQWLVNTLTKKTHDKAERPISAKTVYSYYSLLKTILSTSGVEINGVQLPQRKRPDLNIPEEDLVRRLLASVEGTHLEIPILLAALGPMRRGEICALTMDDIEGNTVHVTKSIVKTSTGEWVVKLPKSAAGTRDILYPEAVINKIRQKGCITNCTPSTISRNFTRHLERHGFPHFRFHDLRHYAASFLLALNIPPVYVMERGGWESSQTMQRYVHALDKQRQEFAAKASDAFGSLL